MEQELLDYSPPPTTIINAKRSFWILVLSQLPIRIFLIAVPPNPSTAKFALPLMVISIVAAIVGLYFAFRSIKDGEDSIWLKLIGSIGNGIFVLAYLTVFFSQGFSMFTQFL